MTLNAGLPSTARLSREQRVRSIRRTLEAHQRIDIGCSCGWLRPRGATIGLAAHRDHVAERLADLS